MNKLAFGLGLTIGISSIIYYYFKNWNKSDKMDTNKILKIDKIINKKKIIKDNNNDNIGLNGVDIQLAL